MCGSLPEFDVIPIEFWRALYLLGWIWRYLEIFFLVLALGLMEMKTIVNGIIVDSINKSNIRCTNLAQFGGEACLLLLGRHGADVEAILTPGAGRQQLQILIFASPQMFNLNQRTYQIYTAKIHFLRYYAPVSMHLFCLFIKHPISYFLLESLQL
jgi:hypothetical protein